jgi:HK97 gp10 family phage protein
MSFSYKLEGLEQLNANMKKLPDKIQKRSLNKAGRAGARVIQKKARQIVQVLKGTLKRSIVVRTGKSEAGTAVVFVTTDSGKNTKNDGWYAHMVEFGTKFAKAFPFMSKAFEDTHKEQLDAVGDSLAKSIIEETAKLS